MYKRLKRRRKRSVTYIQLFVYLYKVAAPADEALLFFN